MPHAGIIDETLEGEQELLARAKLHFKGGLDRFSRGETKDAIAAVYDAISAAMQRFVILNESKHNLVLKDDDVSDDKILFKVLLKSGVFDDVTTQEDFDFIEQTLDDVFLDDLESFDEISYLDISTSLLNQLDIISEDMS